LIDFVSFCSAAAERELCDVLFPGPEEIEKIDASISASFGYRQERKVFVNAFFVPSVRSLAYSTFTLGKQAN